MKAAERANLFLRNEMMMVHGIETKFLELTLNLVSNIMVGELFA